MREKIIKFEKGPAKKNIQHMLKIKKQEKQEKYTLARLIMHNIKIEHH